MPTVPTLVVRVAFPNAPLDLDANAQWSTLTGVRTAGAVRGKSKELDEFRAGSGQVILDNRTRQFEPENTGSIYYPYLIPNRRVQFLATLDGIDFYPIINGYADGWDQEYIYTRDGTCELSMTDGFKILSQMELPAAWDVALAATGPTSRYRLDELAGTTMIDSVGAKNGVFAGAPTLGADGIAYGTVGTAVTFAGDGVDLATINPSPLPTTSTATGISFRSASSAYNPSNVSSLAIAKPAGILTGDILIAGVCLEADTTVTAAPSGWTLIRTDATADTTQDGARLYSYWKLAGASEPSSYAWTFSGDAHCAGGITAWVGVDQTSPIDVHGGQTNNTAGATLCTAPSVTTTVANGMLVTHHDFNPAATADITASQTRPTGMTERVDTAAVTPAGGSNRATIEINSVQLHAAGASGAKQSTLNVNDGKNVGHTIALAPAAPVSPTPFTLAFWARASANQISGGKDFVVTGATTSSTTFLQIFQNPIDFKMRARIFDGLTFSADVDTDIVFPLDTNNLVIVRYDGDTTFKLDSSWSATTTSHAAMGTPITLPPEVFKVGACAATLDELVIWSRYLDDDEVDSLIAVAPDTTRTDLLMGFLLDFSGWPSDLRSIQGTGKTCSNLTAVADPGTPVLDFAQDISITERGNLFMSSAGEVTFDTYEFTLTDPSRTTPSVTFGSAGGAEIPYRSIRITYNDRDIVNEVVVTNTTTDGGTAEPYTETYTAEDPASLQDNGRRTLSIATNLDGTATARGLAVADRLHYELDLSSTAHKEIVGLVVGNFKTKAQWLPVIQLDLMDRVTVNAITPTGAIISQDLTIEGIAWSMTPDDWECTLSLSHGGQRHSYWAVGAAGFSELGETTWLG